MTPLFIVVTLVLAAPSEPAGLVKVGSGVREATFLRVRAYEATLFVERLENVERALEGGAGRLRVEVVMLRSVGREQAAKAWGEAVLKSAGPVPDDVSAELAAFSRWLPDFQ